MLRDQLTSLFVLFCCSWFTSRKEEPQKQVSNFMSTKATSTSRPHEAPLPLVISCKVASLRPQGFHTFMDWAEQPGHVYIGRTMTQYIPGAVGSKWGNPFTQRFGTLEERIAAYEAMVRGNPELMASLHELDGAVQLGCWCAPEPCHGHVLVKLLAERRAAMLTSAPRCDTEVALNDVNLAPPVEVVKTDSSSSKPTPTPSSATVASTACDAALGTTEATSDKAPRKKKNRLQ